MPLLLVPGLYVVDAVRAWRGDLGCLSIPVAAPPSGLHDWNGRVNRLAVETLAGCDANMVREAIESGHAKG